MEHQLQPQSIILAKALERVDKTKLLVHRTGDFFDAATDPFAAMQPWWLLTKCVCILRSRTTAASCPLGQLRRKLLSYTTCSAPTWWVEGWCSGLHEDAARVATCFGRSTAARIAATNMGLPILEVAGEQWANEAWGRLTNACVKVTADGQVQLGGPRLEAYNASPWTSDFYPD